MSTTTSESAEQEGRGVVPASVRDSTFDIVKGISILEVMLHHLLSFCAGRFEKEGSTTWWVMMVAHKVLHFAVPTFLLLTALLLAKSLRRTEKPNWRRFYARRLERTVIPYLIWTAIYLVFRLRFVHVPREVAPVSIGSFTLPALLVNSSEWRANLLWGKAWYHLYFLSILIQFSLLTVLLFPLFKRYRFGFGVLALGCLCLQLGVFWINAVFLYPVLGFSTPASSVLWYVSPILLGSWLGFHWEEWESVWKRTWVQISRVAMVGLILYLSLDIAETQGKEVNSTLYNTGLSAYTTGVGLLLLKLGGWLTTQRLGTVLQRIGNWSFPLFLIHPMMLYFTGSPKVHALLLRLPFPIPTLWTGITMFGATWGMAWVLMQIRVDRWVFGRKLSSATGD